MVENQWTLMSYTVGFYLNVKKPRFKAADQTIQQSDFKLVNK